MIGTTQKRQLRLDRIEAQDIVQRYKEGYFGDDMVLLTVSASRAINFIETWLELNETVACPSCNGQGRFIPTDAKESFAICKTCIGEGVVRKNKHLMGQMDQATRQPVDRPETGGEV